MGFEYFDFSIFGGHVEDLTVHIFLVYENNFLFIVLETSQKQNS